MKTLLKILLLLLILLPTLVSGDVLAGDISLFPARLDVPGEIKAGKTYDLHPSADVDHLKFYNKTDEPITMEMSITNLREQSEMFDADHFKISPQRFTIKPHSSQEVKVKLKVNKKDFINGNYMAIIQGKPIIEPDENDPAQASIGIALGVKVRYTVNGKQTWFHRVSAFIKHWLNRGRASVSDIGLTGSIVIAVLFFVVVGLVIEKLFKRKAPKRG